MGKLGRRWKLVHNHQIFRRTVGYHILEPMLQILQKVLACFYDEIFDVLIMRLAQIDVTSRSSRSRWRFSDISLLHPNIHPFSFTHSQNQVLTTTFKKSCFNFNLDEAASHLQTVCWFMIKGAAVISILLLGILHFPTPNISRHRRRIYKKSKRAFRKFMADYILAAKARKKKWK